MLVEAIPCLVTGASEGIGRAVALELARRRCPVALLARRGEMLVALRDEITAAGGRAEAFVADVADTAALAPAIGRAASWAGGLRLVVVNAGVGVHGAAELLPGDALRRAVDVNLVGALETVRGALPHLRAATPAALVAVSSLSALIPYRGGGAYAASKAGLVAALRCLRLELAGTGLSVGWLCPGPVATAMIVDGVPRAKLPRLARLTVPVLTVDRVAREVVRLAAGRGGQRVVPWTAAVFAAVARHLPRLGEWTELATGAGEA